MLVILLDGIAQAFHALILRGVFGSQRLVHAVAHACKVLPVFLDQIGKLVHPPVLRPRLLRDLPIQIVAQVNQLQPLILSPGILRRALFHQLLVQVRAHVREVLVLVLQARVIGGAVLREFLVERLANPCEVLVVFGDALVKRGADIGKVLPVVLDALVDHVVAGEELFVMLCDFDLHLAADGHQPRVVLICGCSHIVQRRFVS